MAEVHTSRSEFDTLRRLLSFIYNAASDKYEPIKVWENPFNERDFLVSPALTSRVLRERERTALFGATITSGFTAHPQHLIFVWHFTPL